MFSFKIDITGITLEPDPDLDPDPNWAKILDPDPNSMYLDPQHWPIKERKFNLQQQVCIIRIQSSRPGCAALLSVKTKKRDPISVKLLIFMSLPNWWRTLW